MPPLIPAFNRRIPHLDPTTQAPQAGAKFGFSMVMGKVGNPATDTLDDLVVAALGVDSPVLNGVGAVYPFLGPFLLNNTIPDTQQFPIPDQAQLGMGERYPAMGRVDTAVAENLVFMCSPRQAGLGGGANEGAVQVFRALDPIPAHYATLRPLGTSIQTDGALFGNAIAIGDVNGDGVDDLVVGASGTRNCTLSSQGRVYIFFGGNNWLQNPANMVWVAINSPLSPAGCTPPPPTASQHSFGFSVAVVDFDQDGFGEVVVGAPGRVRGGVGAVYIYDGVGVASLATGQIHDVGSAGAVPTSTLVPPATYANSQGNFGWSMFAIGNMGSNSLGNQWSTGRPDLAVHGEGTDYPDAITPTAPRAGAMFIYFGDDTGNALVDSTPVVLFTPVLTVPDPAGGSPIEVHAPQQHGRFGRAAAVVRWPITDNGEPRRHLLIGEPDADVMDPNDPLFPLAQRKTSAGRVFAFQAPLHQPSHQQNAWGAYVLLEPADTTPETLSSPFASLTATAHGPTDGALFGAWIVSGNYANGTDGDEFVVSAREKNIPWPLPTSPNRIGDAGQVYSFRIPD